MTTRGPVMLTRKTRSRALAMIALCLVTSAGVFAQGQIAQPSIKMSLSGAVLRSGGNVAIEQAGAVNPGEVILYTITSHNEGMKPALGYKATGPVPANTVYVQGSAKAEGASELYSIDGGKTFSPTPMIDERQADGVVKKVPAPVSMYTHVRFEWNN